MTTLENLIAEATEILKLNDEFYFLPKTTVDKLASGIRNSNQAQLATFVARAKNNQGTEIDTARDCMAEAVKVSDIVRTITDIMVQTVVGAEITEVKNLRSQLRNFASKVDRQKKPGFERFVARLDALLAVGSASEIRGWREAAEKKLARLKPGYVALGSPPFVLAA